MPLFPSMEETLKRVRKPRVPDSIRLEIGRALHEKTMRLKDVMSKYDVGESVAYKALQIYRLSLGKTNPKTAALYITPPNVDHLVAENRELQNQLQSAHEEIVTLQKILMVVGRTL